MQNKAMKTIANVYGFNSIQFNDRIGNVPDDLANNVVGKNTNPIVWIAGHLINSRVYILSLLGGTYDFPFAEVCKGKYDSEKNYPSMQELTNHWKAINEKLDPLLANATDEQLESPIDFAPPGNDQTIRGVLIFLLYHEAYHFGQVTNLKRNQDLDSVLPF